MNVNKTDSGASAISKNIVSIPAQDRRDCVMCGEFNKGLIEGIKRYAWYDNGVLCVGPFGKTLERALAEIESEYRQKRPGISMKA
jgi:hypothetical protein